MRLSSLNGLAGRAASIDSVKIACKVSMSTLLLGDEETGGYSLAEAAEANTMRERNFITIVEFACWVKT